MQNNKKLYIYSGVAIAGAVLIYLLLNAKNKKNQQVQPNTEEVIEDKTVTTSTGDIITIDQAEIPKSLKDIVDKSLADAKKLLFNKHIYSKVADVNPRTTANVNNGYLNNSFGGKITNKDTFVGNIKDVVEDSGKLKNSSGRVYKWFKILASADAIKQLNDSMSWFNVPLKVGATFYVREDVLRLKN